MANNNNNSCMSLDQFLSQHKEGNKYLQHETKLTKSKNDNVKNLKYSMLVNGKKINSISIKGLFISNSVNMDDAFKYSSHPVMIQQSNNPDFFKFLSILDAENIEVHKQLLANDKDYQEDYKKFTPMVHKMTSGKKGPKVAVENPYTFLNIKYNKDTKKPYYPIKQFVNGKLQLLTVDDKPYTLDDANKIFVPGNVLNVIIPFYALACTDKGVTHPLKPSSIIIEINNTNNDDFLMEQFGYNTKVDNTSNKTNVDNTNDIDEPDCDF